MHLKVTTVGGIARLTTRCALLRPQELDRPEAGVRYHRGRPHAHGLDSAQGHQGFKDIVLAASSRPSVEVMDAASLSSRNLRRHRGDGNQMDRAGPVWNAIPLRGWIVQDRGRAVITEAEAFLVKPERRVAWCRRRPASACDIVAGRAIRKGLGRSVRWRGGCTDEDAMGCACGIAVALALAPHCGGG